MHRRGEAPWYSIRRHSGRGVWLVVGILIPQVFLYWPSLGGRKILLPLDVLAHPGVYLPADEARGVTPRSLVLSDLVYQMEPYRRYAASEVRAGRLPLWDPHNYCGAPFLANNQSAVFSPYRVMDYLRPSPVTLAWTQVVQALVAGCGAYFFFRRAVRVGIVPAVIGAWCYPLSGALVFWTGYTIGATMTFLPWVMLFADRAVRRPRGPAPVGLTISTAAALVAGHSATAAHILIAAGLLAGFRLVQLMRTSGAATAIWRGGVVSVAFLLGITLAAPQVLPTLAYMRTSYRVAIRISGGDPTPVVGAKGIGQIVWPYSFGTDERSSWQFFPRNIPESAASGYAGLVLVLGFGPLAFARRRRRGIAVFFLLLAVIGAAAVLGIPVLSKLFLMFPLNALRNNRFVFVTSFSLLTLGVLGMDQFRKRRGSAGASPSQKTKWISIALLIITAAWCLWRVFVPFEELRLILADASARLATGQQLAPPFDVPDGVRRLRLAFSSTYFIGFFFAVCGLVLLLMRPPKGGSRRVPWIVAVVCVVEMVAIAHNRVPQCDPSLYYPPLRFAEFLKRAPAGRMLPLGCLPANLPMTLGLRDVRGYDAADPARMIELLNLARANDPGFVGRYANVQMYVPRLPSPIIDMLNVRYLVGRTSQPAPVQPMYADSAYWVVENRAALPRAYVPKGARVVNDRDERLRLLADASFAPREVAYVETTASLPGGVYDGDVQIESDTRGRIVLVAQMRTAGMVVLSDLYDAGWKARVNGKLAQVLPTNHALRGVIVPPGKSRIEMEYAPASFTWGLRLAELSVVAMGVWLALLRRLRRMR